MKILVTGAAGYIGSTLVPQLLQAGYEVVALDNFMYRQTSLLACCQHDAFTIVRGDVRDEELMKKLLVDVDAIIPLACLTGAPLCAREPEAARSIIVDAVATMMSLLKPEQEVFYPTTNSGYGIGEKDKYCTEESLLKPVSLYGQLKVEAENLILQSGQGVTFRLATAFGVSPRMRLDLLVNDFTYRAVHDRFIVLFEAHFNRNFIHVRDIGRALLHGLDHFELMKGQAYNVGLSDANLNKKELCDAIKQHVPEFYFVESDIGQDPDKRDYIVSNEKIEATGFKPEVSLSDGIAELVKAYTMIKRCEYANI